MYINRMKEILQTEISNSGLFFAAVQVEVVAAGWLQGASTHSCPLSLTPSRPARVVDVSQPGRGSTSQGALLPQRARGAHRQVAARLLLPHSCGRHQRGLHQGLLWQGERATPPPCSTTPIVVLPVKVFTSGVDMSVCRKSTNLKSEDVEQEMSSVIPTAFNKAGLCVKMFYSMCDTKNWQQVSWKW